MIRSVVMRLVPLPRISVVNSFPADTRDLRPLQRFFGIATYLFFPRRTGIFHAYT
jgi:hypothetical protein